MSQQGSGGNVLAAVCNFFIPGLGPLVQGRVMSAILFFVGFAISAALTLVLIGYVLAPIVYIWCIINAARYSAPKVNFE